MAATVSMLKPPTIVASIACLITLVVVCRAQEPASGSEASTGGNEPVSFIGGASAVTLNPGSEAPSEAEIFEAKPSSVAGESVSVNTDFGKVPVKMTQGEGRFVEPTFRVAVSLSNGYDNNVFSASEKTRPGQPVSNPQGSFMTRGGVTTSMQMANARTSMIMDLTVGALYYWDAPKASVDSAPKESDINGSFNLVLSHQVSPRMRFSSAANIAYLSGPDTTRRYTPIDGGDTSPYYNGNIRLEMEYRWRPRLSTSHFYNLAGTIYEAPTSTSGNSLYHTFGNSVNYQLSPRTTLVAEYRYEISTLENQDLETSSHYLLAGFNYALSNRLNMTLRVGEQLRSSSNLAGTASSPHFEGSLSYIYGNNSVISWSNWYGLEASSYSASEEYVYRTGLIINHALTARISALASMDYSYRKLDGMNLSYGGEKKQTVNLTLGLQYVVSRPLKLSLTYTRTQLLSDDEYEEYSGDKIFMDAAYAF